MQTLFKRILLTAAVMMVTSPWANLPNNQDPCEIHLLQIIYSDHVLADVSLEDSYNSSIYMGFAGPFADLVIRRTLFLNPSEKHQDQLVVTVTDEDEEVSTDHMITQKIDMMPNSCQIRQIALDHGRSIQSEQYINEQRTQATIVIDASEL